MESFIPFGAQYYRAPTPSRDDWERDLKNIREMGFNTIKIWAQWRWNNPARDRYDFTDIDKLMELAYRYGLKVIINTIFDVAPAWFCRMYPDSVMITNSGRRVEYQTVSCRQIGGAPGPCYHHEEGRKYRLLFLEELVKRYREHPALYVWDLWNEPELTCNIFRRPVLDDLVCYCRNSEEEFIKWLKDKYGCIDELNRRWHRNYNSWDEVELPRAREVFKDMIDWRCFFIDTLVNELKYRVELVKKHDQVHPVMVHTVPMPYFNQVTCCSDEYRMARLCDMFGNSIGSHPFSASISMSAAKGKTVINSEIHALGGNTYERPSIPSFKDMKKHILVPLARGIKGFLFWQYRCETLGLEAPAWGLTDLKGEKTEWLEYAVQINNMLQQNAGLISGLKPLPSRVAVVNSTRNQIFDWCASGGIDKHYHSVYGAFMALYRGGYNVDIISCEQVLDGVLEDYKVIYYPFPYYLEKGVAEKLKQWVRAGGLLISEAFFGGITDDTGLHSTEIPSCGFSKVFGVTEGLVTSGNVSYDSYSSESRQDDTGLYVPLFMEKDFGNVKKGQKVLAYYYREELKVDNAEVLARFNDGKAAVTCSAYEAGKAVMIGSLLGYAYSKNGASEAGLLINSLVSLSGVVPYIETDNSEVRADILSGRDGEFVIVVDNDGHYSGKVKFTINVETGSRDKLTSLLTGESTPLYTEDGKTTFELMIDSRDSDIFRLC